jgi:hypothetical protein
VHLAGTLTPQGEGLWCYGLASVSNAQR